MYDFERPTKLELIGFVHPNFRKQHIGTALLQTAMNEIQKETQTKLFSSLTEIPRLGKHLQIK